jgi:hypothetical protein
MQKPEWIQRIINRHRLFIIGIFIFAAIAHTPYLAPGGPSTRYPWPLVLVIDEGTVLYDSFRITCGEVIYRDFFQFQGPVFYYVYAGLFAVTGPSLTASRALNLLITAITATFIALTVARIFGYIAGAGAAAVHAYLLVPMWPYAYPHWLAEAFAFGGIYLIVRSRGRLGQEIAGGACLGLSAATIQSVGLPVLAACMVTLAIIGIAERSWREVYSHSLIVLLGALLGITPFLFYFIVVGAFDQMWYAMFEWVFTHYPEGQKDILLRGFGADLESHVINHARVVWPWRSLAVAGLRFMRLLPIFTICGAIVAMAQVIIGKWRRSLDNDCLIIGISAVAGTSPLLLGITRFDLTHIVFVGGFGLCGLAVALSPLITYKPHLRLRFTIVWAIIGILVVTNFSAKSVMTYRSSRKKQNWKGEILKLAMASWIDANIEPGERIVVNDMGGLQYLYIRRSAVGFTFVPKDTPKYFSDEQWKKLGVQILKALPPVIELTEAQWLQVTQRTPELKPLYKRNNRLLLRIGFTPRQWKKGAGSSKSLDSIIPILAYKSS